MITALECYRLVLTHPESYQLYVNELIDDFRRANPEIRVAMVRDPLPSFEGPMEGLIAAVISTLCRERNVETPDWVDQTWSPEPFFIWPAKSFAMRVRLMVESPLAFRLRRVFVPENYLSRA